MTDNTGVKNITSPHLRLRTVMMNILIAGLCWTVSMRVTIETYTKFISLPREFTRAEIRPSDEKSNAASLSMIWNMGNYQVYEKLREINLNDCSDSGIVVQHYKCVSFQKSQHPAVKRNYYFISHIKLEKISWIEAADLCKHIGGYLPCFTSLQEQDELIAFFKLSRDIPAIEAVYIGLRYNYTTVSLIIFTVRNVVAAK